MRKFFLSIVLASILLTGCIKNDSTESEPKAQPEQKFSLTGNILKNHQAVANMRVIGAGLLDNPNLQLPYNIDPRQLNKFFSIGEFRLTLALKPSMNVPLLEIPKNFNPSFAGILVAHIDSSIWTPWIEFIDNNPEESSKNNPYYLWADDDEIFLSIVDQNGAGSGEGIMKIFALSGDGWKLKSCHYFSGSYTNKDTTDEYDYFELSSNLAEHKSISLETCIDDVALKILQ